MLSFFFTFLFLCSANADLKENNLETISNSLIENIEGRIFEKEIIKCLNCIQNVLKTGLPEVGLPSLEHLQIPYYNVDVSLLGIGGLNGFVIINNTDISGITDMKIENLHVNPIIIGGLGANVKAKLILPSLLITTDYEGDMVFNKNPIYGEGKVKFSIDQFSVDIDIKIQIINKKITTSKLRLVPNIEEIKLEINGFFNDDEQSALLSQLIDEEGVSWVNGKSRDIADVLEEFLKNLINIDVITSNIQNDYAMNDIISAILKKCPLN